MTIKTVEIAGACEAMSLDIRDGVAIITLNRPCAANAIDLELATALVEVAKSLDGDDAIRVVVLTGAGRHFCAGADLRSLPPTLSGACSCVEQLAEVFHAAISVLTRMHAPLITAINGDCAGAGLSLAVCADIAIASETAGFSMGYSSVGLSPDGSSSYFLPRLIGLRRTQELMLLPRKLTAHEACAWGLITQVVPAAELIAAALQVAKAISNGAARPNAIVKQLLHSTFENSLEAQMKLEGRFLAECAESTNGREGILAFLEKRTPRFS